MGVRRWKWIRGYKGLYRISEDGHVRSVKRKVGCKGDSTRTIKSKRLKPFMDGGYWCVNLWKNNKIKKYGLHRLLGTTFISNPKKLKEVCHVNDIKTDNRIVNLVWGTRRDNAKMAKSNGRLRGNHTAKVISDKNVRLVKRLLLAGVPRREIAQRFKISYYTVTDIALGRTRKNVTL